MLCGNAALNLRVAMMRLCGDVRAIGLLISMAKWAPARPRSENRGGA